MVSRCFARESDSFQIDTDDDKRLEPLIASRSRPSDSSSMRILSTSHCILLDQTKVTFANRLDGTKSCLGANPERDILCQLKPLPIRREDSLKSMGLQHRFCWFLSTSSSGTPISVRDELDRLHQTSKDELLKVNEPTSSLTSLRKKSVHETRRAKS